MMLVHTFNKYRHFKVSRSANYTTALRRRAASHGSGNDLKERTKATVADVHAFLVPAVPAVLLFFLCGFPQDS